MATPALPRTSPDWPDLRSWLFGEIEKCHALMEVAGTSDAMTNFLRGQIAAYRALIASVEPVFIPPPVETHY